MLIEITSEVRGILRKAYIANNIMMLPKMSNKEYDQLKYIVEYLGGHWREKLHGFVFNEADAVIQSKLVEVQEYDTIPLEKEVIFQIRNQFYPTPDWLAQEMVRRANIDTPNMLVLEPSAGRGAILKYLVQRSTKVKAVELNRDNANFLRVNGYRVAQMKFEDYAVKCKTRFDRIVMNPPFANEMDLRHTALAYNLLKPKGKIVSLVAENSIYYDRKVTEQFNTAAKYLGFSITEIPHGSFRESGTNVDVVMLEASKIQGEQILLEY